MNPPKLHSNCLCVLLQAYNPLHVGKECVTLDYRGYYNDPWDPLPGEQHYWNVDVKGIGPPRNCKHWRAAEPILLKIDPDEEQKHEFREEEKKQGQGTTRKKASPEKIES